MPPVKSKCLTFVSVGSAIDMLGANTSIVFGGRKRILMDCGYAVPPKFCALFPDPEFLDAIYLTHQHADHSFGLPGLLAWMKAMRRQRPLHLLHGPGAGAWIRALLDMGYPGSFAPRACFALHFQEISSGQEFIWDTTTLNVARSTHKVPNWSLRIDEEELSLAYSGDGTPSQDTINLFRGVDHLIHECSWATPLKEGHGDVQSLLASVSKWSVAHLHLVHTMVTYRSQILQAVSTFDGNVCVNVPSAGDVISLDV